MHLKTSRLTAALAAAATALAGAAPSATSAAAAQPAPTAVIVVAPGGNDHNPGPFDRPVATLGQAQLLARSLSTRENVVVDLEGGTYRPSSPWKLTSADSGSNGHTITYQAAPGQHPVLSGGQRVTGWSLHNQSSNIYVAHVPKGLDSRQLYVDGALAPVASITVPRSEVTITPTGMTITDPSLDYLASLPEQNRIEVESEDSFTDRYSPVQSISGSTITMQEPAWESNTWGNDIITNPFRGGPLSLENSEAFIDRADQWAIDSPTGQLFYEAPAGENMQGSDVELPRLQSLLDVSGSYGDPAHGLAFQGIQFSDTTWLEPSSDQGFANQQNDTYLAGTWQMPAAWLTTCQYDCPLYEATREHWSQIPAAVQVSAASGISFTDDAFRELGEAGLGIGNDADATASGTGLGSADITVTGNTFTDDAGGAVAVGGVQADAHHPSDPAMTNQNILVSDNHISGIGTDDKGVSAVLATYVTNAVITHNQLDHLPYDGIDLGRAWGINDAGGSLDYQNRGVYNYQPLSPLRPRKRTTSSPTT